MPRTKTKSGQPPNNGPALTTASNTTPEVLTLAEAEAYLRVPEEAVLELVARFDFPGRRIGSEWRFLKSALQDWLRAPAPRPDKEALTAVIGTWKDDPDLEDMLREIYQRRGRPMIEDAK